MIAKADKPQLNPMDYGITSQKMWLLALNCFTIGSETYDNGTESARKAGYKGSNNYLARIASETVRKCKMQAAKRAIQADVAKELDHNRTTALNMLVGDYSYLEDKAKSGDIQAINARTAILRELDDISGLKQQTDNRQAVSITITAPEPLSTPHVDCKAITGETGHNAGDSNETG